MSRNRRRALQVEPLEGKVLLSAARVTPRAAAAAALAAQPFSIIGSLKMPTASVVTFTLNGQSMGSFKLSGKLGTMGQVNGKFVALLDANSNLTSGVLVLSNRKGAVTLAMSNDPGDQTAYAYKVASGTGAFVAATGAGKMATSGISANGRAMTFTVTPQ
jgi:hypothetical protein